MIRKIFQGKPECPKSPSGRHDWFTLLANRGHDGWGEPITAVSQKCTHCGKLHASLLKGTWTIAILNDGKHLEGYKSP